MSVFILHGSIFVSYLFRILCACVCEREFPIFVSVSVPVQFVSLAQLSIECMFDVINFTNKCVFVTLKQMDRST